MEKKFVGFVACAVFTVAGCSASVSVGTSGPSSAESLDAKIRQSALTVCENALKNGLADPESAEVVNAAVVEATPEETYTVEGDVRASNEAGEMSDAQRYRCVATYDKATRDLNAKAELLPQ